MSKDNLVHSTTARNSKLMALLQKSLSLPLVPGCYLMKNKKGAVIYVGKAKRLRDRVSSYFRESTHHGPKNEILISHIDEFDYLITETEVEAFVLENHLIKKHAPKYNIRLRDDKSYPYVCVDFDEPFPRIKYQRKVVRNKKKLVFGPFVQGSQIQKVLRILVKSFGLRDCTLREFRSRKKPCLLYQMNQCSASCVGYIDEKSYAKDLDDALDLFKGKGKKTIEILTQRMFKASDDLQFEKAAMLRDFISTLNEFVEQTHQQHNIELAGEFKDLDVWGAYWGDIEVDVSIYMIRKGVLLGHKSLHFTYFQDGEDFESKRDELLSFMHQYYLSTHDELPNKILVDLPKPKTMLLSQALKNELGEKITVSSRAKNHHSLLKLTQEYAEQTQRSRSENQHLLNRALDELKTLLRMSERPRLLECYDVAIWQGSSPAASQVVFLDGRADKKAYRHYHMKLRPEGNNDFEMLREMMSRRIKYGKLPDVMVVDGGKGQVSSLNQVLKEFELEIPVVGIAKSRSEKSQERLFLPGRANPYILSKNPALFRLMVQMRDEAHRFSQRLHRSEEKKRTFHSWLDEIKGIGPKTKQKILSKLEIKPQELAQKDIDEIKELLDLPIGVAQKIKSHLTS